MTLREFIRQHRAEIDQIIDRALLFTPAQASCSCGKQGTDHYCGEVQRRDDDERRQWIVNDEGLYQWARSCGVRV